MAGKLLLSIATLASLAAASSPFASITGCDVNSPPSCVRPNEHGSCCTEAPGGLLLFVQFWDTQPQTGPPDSWTIHGLWPSRCDGSFDPNDKALQCCDHSQVKTSPLQVLQRAGRQDLVDFMDEFWIDNKQRRDHFWNHEWATHGTCASTIKDQCLQGSPQGTGLVSYFERIVNLFKKLPTYQFLEEADITPSDDDVDLKDLRTAVRNKFGFDVTFNCNKGAITEIVYYFHLQGSLVDGKLIPIDPPAKAGDEKCPRNGFAKYLPKSDIQPPRGKEDPFNSCQNNHINKQDNGQWVVAS